MKILHPRVRDAELHQSFELLGNNGFARIGKKNGGWVSQERVSMASTRRFEPYPPPVELSRMQKPAARSFAMADLHFQILASATVRVVAGSNTVPKGKVRMLSSVP
jgi:hypothetical protein